MIAQRSMPTRAELVAAALLVVIVAGASALLLDGCSAPPIETKTTLSVQIASTDNKTRHSRPGEGLPADVALELSPVRVSVQLEETTTAILPASGLELRPWTRVDGGWSPLPSIVIALGGTAELGNVTGEGLWFEVVQIDREGGLDLTLELRAP